MKEFLEPIIFIMAQIFLYFMDLYHFAKIHSPQGWVHLASASATKTIQIKEKQHSIDQKGVLKAYLEIFHGFLKSLQLFVRGWPNFKPLYIRNLK